MNKLSYALGLSIGNNFRTSGISQIDLESFQKGLQHVLEETQPEMTSTRPNKLSTTISWSFKKKS